MTPENRIPQSTWGTDPATVRALRLSRTQKAYEGRDLITALIEAEEILEEDPDDLNALEVLGNIELDFVHGREAVIIYEQLLELCPDKPAYLSGMTVARFLNVEFETAVEMGKRALGLDPGLAEAAAYTGLALEHLKMPKEGLRYLQMAARLAPTRFPLPVRESKIPWRRLVAEALAGIPEELKFFFTKVPLVWHHLPDASVLRALDPPITPLVLALYEGIPPEEGDPTEILPRSMRIFRGNACRFGHDPAQLIDDLTDGLIAEAADWTGIYPESEGEEE